MNHYNGVTIWGVIEKVKKGASKNGTASLEIFVTCDHGEYGELRALCWVFGKERIEDFLQRISPGDEACLEGFMSQYHGRYEVIKTTFTIVKFRKKMLTEQKIGFRIRGKIEEFEGGTLKVSVIYKGNNDYEDQVTLLSVAVPDSLLLDIEHDPRPGDDVSLKGYIIQKMDEYGGKVGEQRPVVKELAYINEQVPAE